jgi:hypothetical protein
MKKIFICLLIFLVFPAQSFGFYKVVSDSLGKPDIGEAVIYGINNKNTDLLSFFKPWEIKKGWESCVVLTKFLEISYVEMIAAREYRPPTLEELMHIFA